MDSHLNDLGEGVLKIRLKMKAQDCIVCCLSFEGILINVILTLCILFHRCPSISITLFSKAQIILINKSFMGMKMTLIHCLDNLRKY